MRRTALVVAVVAGLVRPVSGAAASQYDYSWAVPAWQRMWSAPKLADNRGFAVASTADAVWVAGVTGSHGTGAGDLFVLRYSRSGTLELERTWGGFELDQAQDLAVDADGVWAAGSRTTDEGRIEAVLLRFALDGTLLLERSYARGVLDTFQAVAVQDGRVWVAGLTQPTRNERHAYAAALDARGDVTWETEIDRPGWSEFWDVATDGDRVFLAGSVIDPAAGTTQATVLVYRPDGTPVGGSEWGDAGNDEARALTLHAGAVYVTGGAQSGRSTDVFVAKLTRDAGIDWLRTTRGAVVGGGGYGIAVGERGIYVAGGTYDFPAGGDAAVLRFSSSGELEWSQVIGAPGFWDWSFDVDARDGRFYVAGVLWRPGAEWYRVMTLAYDEDLETTSLTKVARQISDGDRAGAERAMDAFSVGDFLRWAKASDASRTPGSYIEWEGASDSGRSYGRGRVEAGPPPSVAEQDSAAAITGLRDDVRSGNYALVRDYTGVRGSLADGLIRFRYYISHDRLIPQGGYVYVGEVGVALPPPPV